MDADCPCRFDGAPAASWILKQITAEPPLGIPTPGKMLWYSAAGTAEHWV